jgi:cytoplasmic tRNA 2-thiolation protein 2
VFACRECFNAYFVHRFRATFGKVRLFTEGEKVLLPFSGGMNSRVLLGLAEEGLKLSAYKKLRFEPTVVVIDEGAVLGEKWNNRCRQLSRCLAIATATGFSTVYTRIEQVFGRECAVCSVEQLLRGKTGECKEGDGVSKAECVERNGGATVNPCEEGNGGSKTTDRSTSDGHANAELEEAMYQSLVREKVTNDDALEKRIKSLFDSCTSVTAKESLLLPLRRRLLVDVAHKLGYSKVLTGDTATRLAVRLLGNVAQGRGQTLPLDTGFMDDRTGDVAFIRPLREFPANEVAMFASLNGLDSIAIPHFTSLEPEMASIEQLTESFIAGLQVDFPSTTSTVFRTGDKLTVGGDEKSKRCALCQAPSGPPADGSVFTHLSRPAHCDPGLWDCLCYGKTQPFVPV